MPVPKAGEQQKDFLSRCIPIVLDEGNAKDGKQAAAICYSLWKQNKKKEKKTKAQKLVEGMAKQLRK